MQLKPLTSLAFRSKWQGRVLTSRRAFLKRAGLAGVSLAGFGLCGVVGGVPSRERSGPAAPLPWYRRALRWGQTNINELDPTRYDIPLWQDYWKRTRVQAIIVNAGGIVAFYPSKFPLHRRAKFLGDRDLFGDLTRAARAQGISVIARMDSGGAGEEFYAAHPDWFAVDAGGKPFRSRDLYVACVNGPYFREYLPDILREIAGRYHPEGFTDNSWSGLGRNSICHCANCARRFRESSGHSLPAYANWADMVYRDWIQWSYSCRLEIWDLNNNVTRAAGGPDCLWVGMNGGSISGQGQSFRDYKSICERAEIILLDHQSRGDSSGFQNNGETGKLIHGLLGWDKLIPESMAMYQAGRPNFRFSAKPADEARMWMFEGFAGGIQPWWHHLGAAPEDRRAFNTVEPVNRWHEANQQYLTNRQPVATVGVIWAQQNTDFYGRDDAEVLVEQPWRGLTQALIRARIPYLPVHADHIEREGSRLSALVLPNVASLTDRQLSSIRSFVAKGGGLLATGETSLCNGSGEAQPDFALGDLFGAHLPEKRPALNDPAQRRRSTETLHTYLRLSGSADAEHQKSAAAGSEPLHSVLRGFEQTDLLPFGGTLENLRIDPSAEVLLTFVPAFPAFPPESVWMREPRTSIPGLILNRPNGQGRVAFLPADLDRRFARDNLPDHADLLANLVRWIAGDDIPLFVDGIGLIDCHLYHQPGRLILHLVNLTNEGAWRAPISELIPIGPLNIQARLPADVRGHSVNSLVLNEKHRPSGISSRLSSRFVRFILPSLRDHEVAVIT